MNTLLPARAAARADRLARPHHVRSIDGIADHLQREIGLYARAHVEGAVIHQRPAAMVALQPPQIVCDLGLELGVDRLAEIVAQQHVLRRNGRVGFELEHPMSVGLTEAEQRFRRRRNARLERGRVDGGSWDWRNACSLTYPVCAPGSIGNRPGISVRRFVRPGPDRRRGRPTAPIPRWLQATP